MYLDDTWPSHYTLHIAHYTNPIFDDSNGGEGGIRTLGTGFLPYSGLANRRTGPGYATSPVTYCISSSYTIPLSISRIVCSNNLEIFFDGACVVKI